MQKILYLLNVETATFVINIPIFHITSAGFSAHWITALILCCLPRSLYFIPSLSASAGFCNFRSPKSAYCVIVLNEAISDANW